MKAARQAGTTNGDGDPGRGRRPRRCRILMLPLAAASCCVAAQQYESTPVPDLSAMLPESVLSSGQHRILGAHPQGPYRLSFEIESEAVGKQEAVSLPLALVRVHEIQTLAQAISQYANENQRQADESRGQIRIGGESIIDILGAPLDTSSKVVNQFGRNVNDTFKELGRFPGPGVSDPAGASTLEADEPVLASHRLSAASQLNLDVYSSNPSVQRFLSAVARARMNGQVRAGITTVSLGSDAEVQVAGGRIQNEVRSALLNQETEPLEAHNRRLLTEAGIATDTIDRFLAQPVLTPTHKTTVAHFMRYLDGVEQRGALVQALLGARDEVDALEGLQLIRMYGRFHEAGAPIARFIASARLPLALTRDGILVVALPFDVLAWDRDSETVFKALSQFAESKNIDKRQVLVNGVATARSKQSLAVLGFGAKDRYLLRR